MNNKTYFSVLFFSAITTTAASIWIYIAFIYDEPPIFEAERVTIEGAMIDGYNLVGHGYYTSLSDHCQKRHFVTGIMRRDTTSVDIQADTYNTNSYKVGVPLYLNKEDCRWELTSISLFLYEATKSEHWSEDMVVAKQSIEHKRYSSHHFLEEEGLYPPPVVNGHIRTTFTCRHETWKEEHYLNCRNSHTQREGLVVIDHEMGEPGYSRSPVRNMVINYRLDREHLR